MSVIGYVFAAGGHRQAHSSGNLLGCLLRVIRAVPLVTVGSLFLLPPVASHTDLDRRHSREPSVSRVPAPLTALAATPPPGACFAIVCIEKPSQQLVNRGVHQIQNARWGTEVSARLRKEGSLCVKGHTRIRQNWRDGVRTEAVPTPLLLSSSGARLSLLHSGVR